MSFDQDYNGVYLTSLDELVANRQPPKIETTATQEEDPNFSSSYYVDYSIPSSQISSVDPSKASQPSQKKPVVQDIYDEDHYCLAGSSGFGNQDGITGAKEYSSNENDDIPTKKPPKRSCTRNKMIFCAVFIMFFVCTIGGVVALIHFNKHSSSTSGQQDIRNPNGW